MASSNVDFSIKATRHLRSQPLKVAVVGVGGFADLHHSALSLLEREGIAQVLATCDPALDSLETLCSRHRFSERGVATFTELTALLDSCADELDALIISSPIHFHEEHHRLSVERGISCYLEKPPTLDPAQLERMISRDRQALRPSTVGFNHISQPWRLNLKNRLLSGEFGGLIEVGFFGAWRRPISYFSRNGWAGKLVLGDTIIVDSCFGNAMSHYIHNMLFHGGTDGLFHWAVPAEVSAELYRANAIPGPDTVFARGVLEGGIRFRVATTHACEQRLCQKEIIRCEDALIEIDGAGSGRIFRQGQLWEQFDAPTLPPPELLRTNLQKYFANFTGEHRRPTTALADCRPFVSLNAGIYLSCGSITHVEDSNLMWYPADEFGGVTLVLPGIEQICRDFTSEGNFPSERDLPWARASSPSSSQMSATQLNTLRGMLDNLVRDGSHARTRDLENIRPWIREADGGFCPDRTTGG